MHRIDLTRADTEQVSFQQRVPVSVDIEDVVSAGEAHVVGSVEKTAKGYHASGEVGGSATLRCARCLTEFQFEFIEPFDLSLLPRESAPREEETRLGRGDLEVMFYDEPLLDLAALAAEQLELALPMHVICQESCRGLCPRCGANRNTDPCPCKEDGDKRWAPLLDWRPRE